ncbi:MAG: HD domain-containing phosphohydrolase [Prochlorococcaceae cyanobacterium]|jgi:putative two-component system response regulator
MIPLAPRADDRQATVLVVDDTPENLQLMNGLLRERYRVRLANSGEAALRLARQEPKPDLILLDIMMPDLDGYQVCLQLKADGSTCHIPVIFLTAMDQQADQEKGFHCGCVDYITKPISPTLALARVATHVSLKQAKDLLSDHNRSLREEVERRTLEVQKVQEVTIVAMASLAEARDNETGMHIRRTQNYVKALAEELRRASPYADELDEESIDLLFKSAPLHDIGKVGIPDHILLKPGKLTVEEFELMKRHAVMGAQIISSAEQLLDLPSSFLHFAREIAHHHHENWDGSGYPDHLRAEAIPLSARLMAVADVYDALISKRCYKEPFSHADACAFIESQSGLKFDPVVVEAFRRIEERFIAIAAEYSDHGLSPLLGAARGAEGV